MSARIAVLCPGPSLPRYWRQGSAEGYREVIAVNTAAHRFLCDWLAFADWHIVQSPALMRPMLGYICKKGMFPVEENRKQWADLTAQFPLEGEIPARCGFTFPNALKFAQDRAQGAPIDVFGFDCADQPTDFTGQPGDHSDARWAKELPWVKKAWGPNVRVHSALPVATEAWLRS